MEDADLSEKRDDRQAKRDNAEPEGDVRHRPDGALHGERRGSRAEGNHAPVSLRRPTSATTSAPAAATADAASTAGNDGAFGRTVPVDATSDDANNKALRTNVDAPSGRLSAAPKHPQGTRCPEARVRTTRAVKPVRSTAAAAPPSLGEAMRSTHTCSSIHGSSRATSGDIPNSSTARRVGVGFRNFAIAAMAKTPDRNKAVAAARSCFTTPETLNDPTRNIGSL